MLANNNVRAILDGEVNGSTNAETIASLRQKTRLKKDQPSEIQYAPIQILPGKTAIKKKQAQRSQSGPVKGQYATTNSIPFSKGIQVGTKLNKNQMLLIEDPKRYAEIMPKNAVSRMVNAGKLDPMFLAQRDRQDEANVPIPMPLIRSGRVKLEANHIAKMRKASDKKIGIHSRGSSPA